MKKIKNPPNPYDSLHRELLEPSSDATLDVFEDQSRSILSRNESPDVGFRWSANPYRGCFHSCAYCYARRYHEYLDMGAGTDFESKIVIKKDAPALLRKEFLKPSWRGEVILFSGATDCYQPLEAVYQLTRQCLDVCLEFQNPVSIITKSFLVTRDKDLLVDLKNRSFCAVIISIPFSSDDVARKIEPQASTIRRRFLAVEQLAKAGLSVGISLAPTIPGLNEKDMPLIMRKAKDLGAQFAFHSMVRLSGTVQKVFEERIKSTFLEQRVERIFNRIRDVRGGALNDSRFGHRMSGQGTYWKAIKDLFRLSQHKYGLDQFPAVPDPSPFRVPSPQLELTFSKAIA